MKDFFNQFRSSIIEGLLQSASGPDRAALLERISHKFLLSSAGRPIKRTKPTIAVEEKVKTLAQLKDTVATWRKDNNASIGVTTGVFDILHPGHISFLHDASNHCGRLIAIIASDRTVREQKGDLKPMIPQYLRAQSIAALSDVDAVIVSDTLYHKDILEAINADIMFKGHDYEGKAIYGADQVEEVIIIPCAEDKFFSSSQLIGAIWDKKPKAEPEPQ